MFTDLLWQVVSLREETVVVGVQQVERFTELLVVFGGLDEMNEEQESGVAQERSCALLELETTMVAGGLLVQGLDVEPWVQKCLRSGRAIGGVG